VKTLFVTLFGLSLSLMVIPSLAADEAECKGKWEAYDANKDGWLGEGDSDQSSKAVQDAIGAGFDSDADGKVSAAEFTEACKADFKKK
jgi:hypothetical protein